MLYDGSGHGHSYNSIGGNIGGSGGGGSSSRHLSENLDHHSNGFEEDIDRYRPRCQTPLSVLLAVTSGNGVHLFLQGRYRILSIPPPVVAYFDQSTSISASSDLGSVLVCTRRLNNTIAPVANDYDGDGEPVMYQNAPILTLYSIPIISKKRNQLQIISYSYCSIMSHLTTLHEGMKESCSAWSGSLRQLDMKFDQLSNLLTKYGVMPPEISNTTGNSNSNSANDSNMIDKMSIVRRELLNYILGGHSKRSTDTSNAMDQFFTHSLMNDQLLQRLVRSLEANVAGVEGIVRKKILGPVRALMYDVGELHGLVKVMNVESSGCSYDELDEDKEGEMTCEVPLMSEHTSLRLYEASEVLIFVTEQCVSQLVEIRFRLNCMMKWIRGTASQVKARGTAIDSVQRENAKKRRVSEQTLHKIADFLSTTLKSEQKQNNTTKKRGSSECILGILFSDYFCKDKIYIESPISPLKTKTINSCLGKDRDKTIESPSVKTALEISTQIALDLFDEPRTTMRKSVYQTSAVLDECIRSLDQIVTCVHNRIGAAPNSSPETQNCFNPNIVMNYNSNDNIGESQIFSQNWTIVVNSCSSTKDGQNLLQISALPEYNNNYSALEFDELEDYNCNYFPEQKRSFYITTFVLLPHDCKVSKIKMYGDNGNSTLTSETSLNNEEGRQALGLLLQRNRNSDSGNEGKISEELWLFNYDELDFRAVSLQSESQGFINSNADDQIIISKFDAAIDSYYFLTANDDDDDVEKDDGDCRGENRVVSKCKCKYCIHEIIRLIQ